MRLLCHLRDWRNGPNGLRLSQRLFESNKHYTLLSHLKQTNSLYSSTVWKCRSLWNRWYHIPKWMWAKAIRLSEAAVHCRSLARRLRFVILFPLGNCRKKTNIIYIYFNVLKQIFAKRCAVKTVLVVRTASAFARQVVRHLHRLIRLPKISVFVLMTVDPTPLNATCRELLAITDWRCKSYTRDLAQLLQLTSSWLPIITTHHHLLTSSTIITVAIAAATNKVPVLQSEV